MPRAAARRLASIPPLVLGCALLAGCGGGADENPDAAADGPRSNDSSNRLDWTVSPKGVGPLRLGWTVTEATESGHFEAADETGPCGAAPPVVKVGGDVLYAGWDYSGLDHVAGYLVKNSTDFRTAADIGVGSSVAELRRAYGPDLRQATYDPVNDSEKRQVPVLYAGGGALVFLVEGDRVEAMQVLVGEPGDTLVNAHPGGC